MPRFGNASFLVVPFVGGMVLAGCAGVLGFEDIVVEDVTSPDGGTSGTSSTSSSSGGTSSSGSLPDGSAPKKCSATTPFGNLKAVDGLRDEAQGEAWPRLSSDERTIVFSRAVALGVFRSFIARRADRDGPFDTATALPENVVSPSLSRDGQRLYFMNFTGGKKILASAKVDDAANPDQLHPLDVTSDEEFPIRSDATDETFFASNRAIATDAVDPAPYSLYRLPGPFGGTQAPERIALSVPVPVASPRLTEPVLSADGVDLYFSFYSQTETDVTARGTFVSSRASKLGFGPVVEVKGFDEPRTRLGWISDDGCRAYVYSYAGGTPVAHLYTMDRAP